MVAISSGVKPLLHNRGVNPLLQPDRPKIVQRGCELDLFLPRKVGNLDCTFCLDCVHACSEDNIGILARVPGEELAFALALLVEPAILLGGAAWLTRRAVSGTTSLWQIINRFSRSLVPLGFGVWLVHYGFHFLTGALTVIPVAQYSAARVAGWNVLGAPRWQWGGLSAGVVLPIELAFMIVGVLGALLLGWRIASTFAPARKLRAFAPWALVSLLLFATACWTMLQPMDMRVTFLAR